MNAHLAEILAKARLQGRARLRVEALSADRRIARDVCPLPPGRQPFRTRPRHEPL